MKQAALTKRAKVSYILSAFVFSCGLAALFSGYSRLGAFLGVAGLSFAIEVANANGQFTKL